MAGWAAEEGLDGLGEDGGAGESRPAFDDGAVGGDEESGENLRDLELQAVRQRQAVRPSENAGAMSWRGCRRDSLLPRIDFDMTITEQTWRQFQHNRWFSVVGEIVDAAENQFKRWPKRRHSLAEMTRNYLRRCV